MGRGDRRGRPHRRLKRCDRLRGFSAHLYDLARPERRDPDRERGGEPAATVAVEEGREWTFLLVRVGGIDDRCRLVFEVHYETHAFSVRRVACGSIEGSTCGRRGRRCGDRKSHVLVDEQLTQRAVARDVAGYAVSQSQIVDQMIEDGVSLGGEGMSYASLRTNRISEIRRLDTALTDLAASAAQSTM